MDNDSITRIFCDVDDFCSRLKRYGKTHLLSADTSGRWFPEGRLALSVVMTIVILFHLSGYRCFKWYYQRYVCTQLSGYFPHVVSYNRFVELMGYRVLPLALYTPLFRRGKPTGISFIDSTPIKVCHNRRIYQHNVFKGYAERGKSSTGWFYGFKLHLIINDRGELCAFYRGRGNVDDRDPGVIERVCRDLWGKLFGDRGYISRELFERRGIKLITRLKKNMKNKLMDMEEKLLLRKRAVIESVHDFLKNICQVEHSRHRSKVNFLVNLFGALSASCFLPHKPSIQGIYNNRLLPLLV